MKNNYEIWAIGYNKDDEITDVDECIKTLEDVSEDEAIEFAHSLNSKEDIVPLLKADKAAVDEISYFNIVVEVRTNENHLHIVYSEWSDSADKTTYKIEFLADLTEDDIRAMRKYFVETMEQDMDITPYSIQINKF